MFPVISQEIYSNGYNSVNNCKDVNRVSAIMQSFKKRFYALIPDPPLSLWQLKTNEQGRAYMTAVGTRKSSKCVVKVIGDGSGYFNINGSPINYFRDAQFREQVSNTSLRCIATAIFAILETCVV